MGILGKNYFKNELALKDLFGNRAFTKLKNLLDPCCSAGILSYRFEVTCGESPGLYNVKVYVTSSIPLEKQLVAFVISMDPSLYPLISSGTIILLIPDLSPNVEVLIQDQVINTGSPIPGVTFYGLAQTFSGIKAEFTGTYPTCE